jgi:hypothetical protein
VAEAPRALTGGETAQQLFAVRTSPSLFNVLGVQPAMGRAFTDEEATIGNEQVVILSDALWRTRFGAREDIVGSDIEFDGELTASSAATEPERVAIVDEIFAGLYWPNESPLGQRVRIGWPGEEWATVVGVVPAMKSASLAERATGGTIYWHYTQQPVDGGFLALRTALPPSSLAQAAAREVASIDRDVPLFDSMAMNARIAESLGEQRAPIALTAVFAGVAFTLAIVGIYGVLAWAVTRRTAEIGVRMALGARSPDVLAMVLRQAGTLLAIGLVGGVLCALGLGRLVSSLMYDVSAIDPTVFASALLGLSVAGFAASWVPARSAARLDPLGALRHD